MLTHLRNPLRYQDFYVGLTLVVVAFAGILDIVYGNWKTGQAMGPQAFPRVAYFAILAAGLVISAKSCLGRHDPKQDNITTTLATSFVMITGGVILFLSASHLGFTVSLALALIGGCSLLTKEPLRHWKSTILTPVIAATVMYFMFVELIRIPI